MFHFQLSFPLNKSSKSKKLTFNYFPSIFSYHLYQLSNFTKAYIFDVNFLKIINCNTVLTFNKLWIHHFAPPMLTLNIRSIRKMAGDKIPPFAMDFHESTKLFILSSMHKINQNALKTFQKIILPPLSSIFLD